MTEPQLEEQFDQMSPAEQILLVQALWDRIARRPEQMPVRDSHLDEVRRRLEEHDRTPDDVVDWDDVKAELRSRR
jgi:putative addiction module component (TIGR02574 family)